MKKRNKLYFIIKRLLKKQVDVNFLYLNLIEYNPDKNTVKCIIGIEVKLIK